MFNMINGLRKQNNKTILLNILVIIIIFLSIAIRIFYFRKNFKHYVMFLRTDLTALILKFQINKKIFQRMISMFSI